ncbi:MAG: hypothetical protein AAB295_10420 [Chloroflexota bacterium]
MYWVLVGILSLVVVADATLSAAVVYRLRRFSLEPSRATTAVMATYAVVCVLLLLVAIRALAVIGSAG